MKRTIKILSILLIFNVMQMSLSFASDDAGHNDDYRTFHADRKVEYGKISDTYSADLVMYLAGNQFMVMEELITDFQKKNPNIKSIFVATLPPGQILKQLLLKQGTLNGEKTAMNPDLFASVNIKHLKKLNKKGLLDTYNFYTHNKLELMIAKGNPKNIKGYQDLARDDLVQSHPNPLTEGIGKFYVTDMLQETGLYHTVTNGIKCHSCWAVPKKTWFTARHHRETPHRIENGQADVGLVWVTEVVHAKKQGRALDGVAIPAPYNQKAKVSYAVGIHKQGRSPENAKCFLQYLATAAAQDIYASYGFVKATEDELKIKIF